RDRGPPRCWGQGGRAQARLAQELFHLCQDSGAQRHEEFSERAAARVMSANDPKRTCRSHRLAVFRADEIDAQLRGLFVGQSLPTKRTPGEKLGSMAYCRNKAFLTLAMTRPGVDEHVAHVL